MLKPNSWLSGLLNGSSSSYYDLVHLPILKVTVIFMSFEEFVKEQAKELLLYYRNHYELMMDCPDVVDYNEMQQQTSHMIDEDSFELVIAELVRMGEVSLGHSKSGDKVLKFKVKFKKFLNEFKILRTNRRRDLRASLRRMQMCTI